MMVEIYEKGGGYTLLLNMCTLCVQNFFSGKSQLMRIDFFWVNRCNLLYRNGL